jgi:urease alpha subunit
MRRFKKRPHTSPSNHGPHPAPNTVASQRLHAVKNTRKIGKKDMVLNDATPAIAVDPETYKVTATQA